MEALTGLAVFIAGLFTAFAAWVAAAFIGVVTLAQIVEAAARVIRATIFITLCVAAINLLIPPGWSSVSGLWDTYAVQLGDVSAYLGLLFPIDLLFMLVDWYLFGVAVLFSVSVIRRVFEAAR